MDTRAQERAGRRRNVHAAPITFEEKGHEGDDGRRELGEGQSVHPVVP